MRLNVRKDILFLFAMLSIVGIEASSQSEHVGCSLKVFANDPYAQIYVNNKSVGSPPQIIECSDQEKNIVVKSSDGQIFSRLMMAKNNFDLTNSTLNVVFQKKISDFVYQTGMAPTGGLPKMAVDSETSTAAQELQSRIPVRDVSSTLQAPLVAPLVGNYVQIFALKNLDMSKIEQDINYHYNGKVSQREITVCPWQSSNGTQMLSLVLVGPFSKKSTALEAKNAIGGKSFVVTNPTCRGDVTKVSR
jgi:hypothetical protein